MAFFEIVFSCENIMRVVIECETLSEAIADAQSAVQVEGLSFRKFVLISDKHVGLNGIVEVVELKQRVRDQ